MARTNPKVRELECRECRQGWSWRKTMTRWRFMPIALGAVAVFVGNSANADGLFLPVGPAAAAAKASAARTAPGRPGALAVADAWERRVRIAPGQLTAAHEEVASGGTGRLLLNVRDGVGLDVVVERTAPTRWGYSLSGRVAGAGVGFVTLVVHEEVVAGSIWTPSASHELLPVGGGVHALRDVTNMPPVQCDGVLEPGLAAVEDATADVDDGSVVDVLLVYTAAAEERVRAWTDSPAAARSWIEAFHDMAIAFTNDALERSGAFVSLHVVGSEKIDHEATTRAEGSLVLRSDDVKALRDRLGADLVHATVGCCRGAAIGGGLSYLTPGRTGSAIFVAHEIGHSFGIRHERYEFVGAGGTAGYEHGFSTGLCDQTIMAAGNDCGGGQAWARPPLYASPWRYTPRDGRALGVTRFSNERGARGAADAVLTINRNRHHVANLRPSRNGSVR